MATDSFINQLMEERSQKVQVIETLAATAAEENRDLHTTDLETIDNYRSRIRFLDNQIEKVAGDLEMADSVKSRIRSLDPSIIAKDFTYRTAGAYLWDGLHRHENSDANGRWQKFHRAAEHMGLNKATTVPTAGGFNGIVIAPSVGALLNPAPTGRPLFNALGVTPITSTNFLRPRIVDPNFKTGVGVQVLEKSELASKAWDILSDPVQARVIGGYINVSELLIDMVSSSLDMIIAQMNKRLEYASEAAAVAEIALTAESIPLAADATSADITTAIGLAAATVFRNTGGLPTWIAMGADAWGRLIGTSDLAGRPMLPATNPVNAYGSGGAGAFVQTLWGMQAVVSYAIDDATIYMGNALGMEVYEKPLPLLSAVEPSVFGRQISVQTAIAFYRPISTEPAVRNGVVKIVWAP